MTEMRRTNIPGRDWDRLHEDPRYRPVYPSEPVVRFVSRRFGGVSAAEQGKALLLDLGCGAGRHSAMLSTAGHIAVGVDRSVAGLRHAREMVRSAGAEQRPIVADMTTLPLASQRFDGVVAYGVINYAMRAGVEQAVREIHRVLKPGGWAHVVTRTDEDHRVRAGREVEPATFVLDIDETSEQGMMMHFLSRADVDEVFADFEELIVDRIDHSSGGGSIQNSDWVIEARR